MVINEKWDACLERTVINLGIGLVAGGLGSLIIARESCLRKILSFYPSIVPTCLSFWPSHLQTDSGEGLVIWVAPYSSYSALIASYCDRLAVRQLR